MLRSDDTAPRAIEEAVLRREHDDRDRAKNLVVLDQRAGLITVEPRHHDVHEHDIRVGVGNLGKRIEPIDGRVDLATLLREKRLGRPADRLTVVDDQYLEALELRIGAGHVDRSPSPCIHRKPQWWLVRAGVAAVFNISAYPVLCQTRHVLHKNRQSLRRAAAAALFYDGGPYVKYSLEARGRHGPDRGDPLREGLDARHAACRAGTWIRAAVSRAVRAVAARWAGARARPAARRARRSGGLVHTRGAAHRTARLGRLHPHAQGPAVRHRVHLYDLHPRARRSRGRPRRQSASGLAGHE